MNTAQLYILAVAPSLDDCDDKGFAVALLSRDMTWLIEEMPHGDVAGFCLATPRNYVSGEGSRTDVSQGGCDGLQIA